MARRRSRSYRSQTDWERGLRKQEATFVARSAASKAQGSQFAPSGELHKVRKNFALAI
jgi:hypothetical protein